MLQQLVGAFVFTYFASRVAFLVKLKLHGAAAIIVPHLMSFAILVIAIFLMRNPVNAFALSQLWIYLVAQVFWCGLDYVRGRVSDQRSFRA